MENNIIKKLESSRKELLDFSLRNPLINFKHTKNKGIHVVKENPLFVFDLLVKHRKSMTFIGTSSNSNIQIQFGEEKLEVNTNDNKLQTKETELSLQKKLLSTFYTANTTIEEQGVNTLFLCLGLLEWYENENSNEAKHAPIILIPVALERLTGKDKFKLKYTEEDIGMNISLQAKLKNDFGIRLPDLPEVEDLNIDDYFKEIKKSLKLFERWKINIGAIELGFFSFGKFLIYNDLDVTKWPKDKQPFMNPIFQGLMGEGNHGLNPDFGEHEFIDSNPNTERLFQVVDADSSQIQSMLSIHEGRNQIIQGPPGTGKSQTITNIIANAIGHGKKVLFVAEKMAALEVVKNRLDNLNLGDSCLELHSHKANKKDFLAELKRITELGKPVLSHLEADVLSLKRNRENLNKYSEIVNSPTHNSHLTFHQVLGQLLQIKNGLGNEEIPKIPIDEIKDWGTEKLKIAEDFADSIQVKLNEIGEPSKLLFWGTELSVILPTDEIKIKAILEKVIANLIQLSSLINQFSAEMGLDFTMKMADSNALMYHLELSSKHPNLDSVDIKNPIWIYEREKIAQLIKTGKKIDELKTKYQNIFIEEIWSQEWISARLAIAENENKWYKFLISKYTNHKKTLLSYRKSNVETIPTNLLEILDDLIEGQKLEKEFLLSIEIGESIFGRNWVKGGINWNQLNEISQYLAKVHDDIISDRISNNFIQFLIRNEEIQISIDRMNALRSCMDSTKTSVNDLLQQAKFNPTIRFKNETIWEVNFIDLIELFKNWKTEFHELQKAIAWNVICGIAIEENLTMITDAATAWKNANLFLKDAILKMWLECNYEKSIQSNPVLSKFDRVRHEEATKQFVKADQINFQLNKAKVALKHFENLPYQSAGGQISILRTEFNKKARHLPIRKLIIEAGNAIQSIKPVFMMSPLSIANFLPPGTLEFDLVIFDEASQVKPVEAFGAIIRGKQLVVVGDSKQLPPTNFFDSISNEEDDEDNVTTNMESIIGLCDSKGIGVPQKMLRWHYRSKHESLIKFSNHQYYDNKLVVFPSPDSTSKLGLVFHHNTETVYDRGLTRTNKLEAKLVVERLIFHIQNNPEYSIGVVAFSAAQRQAIEDEFELQRNNFPEIEKYIQLNLKEPLFIKNIENVQGDERDVILISIGYGKSKDGYVSMSFGPLNNVGGEKRLNVLVTRAKLKCEVFTNLTSDDINIEKSQSQGLIALKNFLYFAQKGSLNLTAETGKPADSYFEEHVAKSLRDLGYLVSNQVGSNGFFIDLAIVDNEKPGKYILGIECDGRMYHSARSARDRDRLRQQVLEGMGWKIHRIWSTDWFKNQEFELRRLIEAIERAKISSVESNISDKSQVVKLNDNSPVKREKPKEVKEKTIIYKTANLSVNLYNEDLHTQQIHKLASWIEQVVKIESPVHFDEVARRIMESAGIAKLGSRIREALTGAVNYAKSNSKVIVKNDFLYNPEQAKIIVRNRENLPSGSKKIKFIAEEEILEALKQIVFDAFAISIEEAIQILASTFGFLRVTDEISTEFENYIKKAIRKKLVINEAGMLKANQ
jgi:very-short-patch-repair endonuclease